MFFVINHRSRSRQHLSLAYLSDAIEKVTPDGDLCGENHKRFYQAGRDVVDYLSAIKRSVIRSRQSHLPPPRISSERLGCRGRLSGRGCLALPCPCGPGGRAHGADGVY